MKFFIIRAYIQTIFNTFSYTRKSLLGEGFVGVALLGLRFVGVGLAGVGSQQVGLGFTAVGLIEEGIV